MKIFRDSRIVLAVLAASSAVFAAPPAPAAKPAAPGVQAAPPPASEDDEHAYVYDPAGRRDPFKSLLVRERSQGGERPPGIPGLSVDELELQGLWKTRSGWIAQVRGSDNRSYLLRKGDLLFDGEVLDVRTNELTLRQNVNDPQSVKPFRDVTKRLNAARPE
jgi:type IV pilus assembly protein PilP